MDTVKRGYINSGINHRVISQLIDNDSCWGSRKDLFQPLRVVKKNIK
jgi:hypothetical protein